MRAAMYAACRRAGDCEHERCRQPEERCEPPGSPQSHVVAAQEEEATEERPSDVAESCCDGEKEGRKHATEQTEARGIKGYMRVRRRDLLLVAVETKDVSLTRPWLPPVRCALTHARHAVELHDETPSTMRAAMTSSGHEASA